MTEPEQGHLGGGEPITIQPVAGGWLSTTPSDRFTDPHGPKPPLPRATSTVVLQAPAPVVYRGAPIMPEHRVVLPVQVLAPQGDGHIRSVDDPAPVWNPDTGTWTYPPGPAGVGDYRWTVATLLPPEGFVGGSYPLGDRSGNDETTEIDAAATAWDPDPATGGPAWRSSWPFKPTVAARSSMVGGKTVRHPVGVLLSSSNAGHMWLDMGANKAQPFTWVIAAMSLRRNYDKQTLLDAGRNPFVVGFPVPTPAQLGNEMTVADGLAYRTSLAMTGPTLTMATKPASTSVAALGSTGVKPRMYATVFNGANSRLYVRDTTKFASASGAVDSGAGYGHRYYVLGREFGRISPTRGCEMMVFEIRFWARVLTEAEIDSQYTELSATYQFDRYK